MPNDDRAPRPQRSGLSRRALFTGVGTSAALITTAAMAPEAGATPARVLGDGSARPAAHPDGAPISTAIGSAPISGYEYRTACMYDFLPFDPAAAKTWGGNGIYSAGTSTAMRANIDIPSGALVRDVEWYVYNSGASQAFADLYQYAPGHGTITTLSATATIPASGSTIVAVRATVPSTSQGPFPIGSRLLASLTTPTDGSVQINGARVGFTRGGATVGLLPKPVRVFDNRHGSRFHAGSTHTITLPASDVQPGVVGVLLNVTAVDGAHGGALKIWSANASAPADPALHFGSGSVTEALTVGISNSRQVKIRVSKPVHVVVDLVGTMS